MTEETEKTRQFAKKLCASCINCHGCVRECEMLKQLIPEPASFFKEVSEGKKVDPILPYSCTLCRRCVQVCPYSLDIPELMMCMRRDLVQTNHGKLPLKQQFSVSMHQVLSFHPLFTYRHKGGDC